MLDLVKKFSQPIIAMKTELLLLVEVGCFALVVIDKQERKQNGKRLLGPHVMTPALEKREEIIDQKFNIFRKKFFRVYLV
ncbi:MAG: Unknown protein [uncultured Sulfurovum sp.]|uniref:Uncharacterized protein n=1 Tax=uncultured Sulfurovum sp. TaxID=269237 RepID=A0A6S6RVQ2_9BACT|nr:MAG: Unknown protein [uncultured Sulfurovum sp.]